MTYKIENPIKFILFILLILSLTTAIYLHTMSDGWEEQEVPCYDKYGNEIEDAVCREKRMQFDNPKLKNIYDISVLGGWMFIIVLVFSQIDWDTDFIGGVRE